MTLGPILAVVIAAASLVPDAPGVPAVPDKFQFAAVPVLAYGSDVGFTAATAAFLYRDGGVPGRYERVSLSAAWATRGPRCLALQWNVPRVQGSGWGVLLDGRVADDDRAPYWGEGGELGGSTVVPGAGSAPDEYRYHERHVFLSATLRPVDATGPSPYFRARWLDVDIVSLGPVLAASMPRGVYGGAEALAEVGVFIDTRDRDTGTHRGVLANASVFGAPPAGAASAGAFGGVNLMGSVFVPANERVTLAFRALLETKVGQVPFYERGLYEGLLYGGGLGGAGSLRGMARCRLSGEDKGLFTGEVRTALWTIHPTGNAPLELGLAGGMDAGFSRQRGYPALTAGSVFGGLRALWDRAVLFRVELGYAGQGATALYLVTGEQF